MATTDDPATLAASTAQGWAVTLNAAARPAPEHIEAAQEALNALTRAHWGADWSSVQDTLSEALETARLRVDGGRLAGSVTIAELRGALDELTALGLAWPQERADPAGPTVPRFVADGALARADHQRAELLPRIAELEEELENTRGTLENTREWLRRQCELRDRFKREAQQAHRELKAAQAKHVNAMAAVRAQDQRLAHRWLLGQLGSNAPGYDEMSADELRQAAVSQLGDVQRDAAQLRQVMKELQPAWAALSGTERWFGDSNPVGTARDIARMAEREARAHEEAVERRLRLEDEVAKAQRDPDLTGDERREALVELTSLRRRVAELEATLRAERDDADDADATLSELRSVRAERDELLKARDAQAAELRTLRTERDDAEHELATLRGTAPEADQR